MSRPTITIDNAKPVEIAGHEHIVTPTSAVEYVAENRAVAYAYCADCKRSVMLGYDSVQGMRDEFLAAIQ